MNLSKEITHFYHQSQLIRTVILFIAWLGVWQIGRLVEYTDHASVWFPVSGFTFACFMVLGKRAFLPIMAGAIVITIWQIEHYQIPLNLFESTWAGFLFGLAHILPYWLGAHLIARISQKEGHNAPQLIVTFLVVAGVSAYVVTALVISSLVVTNQMPLGEVKQTLLPFFIGDMAGVVVLAPLFSGILVRYAQNPIMNLNDFISDGIGSIKNLINKISLNISLIILTMLLAYWLGSQESSFAIFFLAVTHMWIACTESPKFNIMSLAISSLLIALLVHLLGLMDHVMVYQFAIIVIAANALFGIAVPQLQAHNKTLQQLVFTDSLTKVSSRHYMEERAKLEIAQSLERNEPLTLVVFDLDNFKVINDQFGHNVGDEVLTKVAKISKSLLRRNDVIARMGGDEFVIMLPGLDQIDSQAVIERIRLAIIDLDYQQIKITSSYGMAELMTNEGFTGLFHRADQALYRSKEQGGNRLTRASN